MKRNSSENETKEQEPSSQQATEDTNTEDGGGSKIREMTDKNGSNIKHIESDEPKNINSIGNCTGALVTLKLEDNKGKPFTFHFCCITEEAVHLVTEFEPDKENAKEWGFPVKLHKKVVSVKGLPEKNTQPIIVTADVAAYLKDHPEVYPGAVFSAPTIRNVYENGRDPQPVKYLTLWKESMSDLKLQPEITVEKEKEEATY